MLPRMERLEKYGVDQEIDFVFIPKQESKNKTLELVVTDPESGIHICKEKDGHSDYIEFRTDLVDEEHSSMSQDPIGQVKYLAFNSRKNYLAMYCDADAYGRIVLLKDLREELNRIDRTYVGGTQLSWCGNDCIILSVFDQLVIIGPNDMHSIDLKCRTDGMFFYNESDGVRVITSEYTYFLELVQPSLKQTFALASISPSAELHKAQKSVEQGHPRADEIISKLEREDKLIEGIETLMNAAEYEHKDVDILKHLLQTAAFAKKFVEPSKLDPNKYVDLVKLSIVLTKLRNSTKMSRAISYH